MCPILKISRSGCANISSEPFSHLQEMSNFCLLPDKMDNRVIHDIVALNIHIKVIIIEVIIATLSLSCWRGCNWNNSLNHQRRQFILPDSTRSGWNHLCFPQQPIVLGCTTVLYTLHLFLNKKEMYRHRMHHRSSQSAPGGVYNEVQQRLIMP